MRSRVLILSLAAVAVSTPTRTWSAPGRDPEAGASSSVRPVLTGGPPSPVSLVPPMHLALAASPGAPSAASAERAMPARWPVALPQGVAAVASAGDRPPAPSRTESMLVAVPATRTVGDVPARLQAALEQALVTEVRKLDGVGAIGASEIGDAVSAEVQGRMRGCTQDEACLLEVAQGLGLTELLSSEVVAEGDTYTIGLRRVNVKTGRAVLSETRKVPKGNGDELLQTVGPLMQALYPNRVLKPGASRGVAEDQLKRLNPPPLPVWVFATTTTAAVVSLVAGGAFAIQSQSTTNQYNSLVVQSKTQVVSGAQLNSLSSQADASAERAKIFLIAGGALAAAAITEAFFTDWHGYRSQVYVLPAEKGSGAVVGMAARF